MPRKKMEWETSERVKELLSQGWDFEKQMERYRLKREADLTRQGREKVEEAKLSEMCMESLSLFGSVFLPHHVPLSYAPFHLRLLKDLEELAGITHPATELTEHKETETPQSPPAQGAPHLIDSSTLSLPSPSVLVGGDGGVAQRDGDGRGQHPENFCTQIEDLAAKLGDGIGSGNLELGDVSRGRLVVAAPRGHAKSTLISLLFPLFAISYGKVPFILLISDTQDQARLNLEAIRAEVESNDLWKEVYKVRPGNVWGADTLDFSNGVRVMCRGTGQRIRGLKYRADRPGLVICDDLEADEHVETEEAREKTKRWFYGALLPSMKKGGRIVTIGTVLHQDSLLMSLLSAKGWAMRRYEVETGGVPLWPEHYTMDDIERLREEYSHQGKTHLFYQEYYNRIVDPTQAIFSKDLVKQITIEEILKMRERGELKTYLTVDPAYATGSQNDYTAMIVTMTDALKNLYVVDVLKGKWRLDQTIDRILDLVEHYQPTFGIQTIDWEKSLKLPMTDRMRARGLHFQTHLLPTYSKKKGLFSKNARVERLAPYYRMGKVFHVEQARGVHDLEQEMWVFPHGKHDDALDALAMAIDLILPAPVKRPKSLIPSWYSEGDPVSGYG